MRIRVIDYVANPGGGLRFAVELLRALVARRPHAAAELITHGSGLAAYTTALRRAALAIPIIDIPPHGYWRTLPATRVWRVPGSGRVKRLLGFDSRWYYDVPQAALTGCDVAWFPWLHRHRLPIDAAERVVGSFHDAIVFLWPDLISPAQSRDERITTARWLASPARIAVSSKTTLGILTQTFNAPADRFVVIPVSGEHPGMPRARSAPTPRALPVGPYLLCPANTSAHKNHEVLLAGFAQWGAKVPLVLTGYGADLAAGDRRGRRLRSFAAQRGLQIGKTLFPLGYVTDGVYDDLLARAWALVMPSRLEGGGSFPVMEAMALGVPVVCADIPVLREQIERSGGEVVWFDPQDAADLARQLEVLKLEYETWRTRARTQVSRLRRRSWGDVADEYWAQFDAAVGREGAA